KYAPARMATPRTRYQLSEGRNAGTTAAVELCDKRVVLMGHSRACKPRGAPLRHAHKQRSSGIRNVARAITRTVVRTWGKHSSDSESKRATSVARPDATAATLATDRAFVAALPAATDH